jgi:hypothetical protein
MSNDRGNRNYAESVNYWGTSRTSADEWLDKAKREIRAVKGLIEGSGIAEEEQTGRAAFVLTYTLDGDRYQIKWPVLQSKNGNMRAAKIQAATCLYHDVKSCCVRLKFLGARAAFLPFLLLPSGQTAAEAANADLMASLPKMLVADVAHKG